MSDTDERRAQDLAKQQETEQWAKISTYVGGGFIAVLSWVALEVYGFTDKNEQRISVIENTTPRDLGRRLSAAEQEIATLRAEMKDMKYFRRTLVEHMMKSRAGGRKQLWPDGP